MGDMSVHGLSVWLTETPVLGMAPIDHLFNRLDGKYPGKFGSMFKTEQQVRNWRDAWAEAFDEVGLTFAEVRVGLSRCRELHPDWPPTDAQFVIACRPGAGLGAEALFHRAVSEMGKRRSRQPQTWPSNVLFWAAAKLGNDLLKMDYKALAGRWAAALAEAESHPDRPIPDVEDSRALPAPSPAMSRQEADKLVKRYGVGVNSGKSRSDWALQIAERPAGVCGYARKLAYDALIDMRIEVPAALADYFRTAA